MASATGRLRAVTSRGRMASSTERRAGDLRHPATHHIDGLLAASHAS